ncbi:hypothetical protein GOODEAATRI_021284, partial [Goodea atripinnis]
LHLKKLHSTARPTPSPAGVYGLPRRRSSESGHPAAMKPPLSPPSRRTVQGIPRYSAGITTMPAQLQTVTESMTTASLRLDLSRRHRAVCQLRLLLSRMRTRHPQTPPPCVPATAGRSRIATLWMPRQQRPSTPALACLCSLAP